MIVLDSSTKLEIVLSGAADPAPVIHVVYVDYNPAGMKTIPATYRADASGSSDVTILPAPNQNPAREVLAVSVYNADNASVTATIKTDNGTEKIITVVTLATLETLFYEKGQGWYAITTAGALKNST